MSFLGPVNKLGDVLVRPHDVELLLEPNGVSTEALIDRITYLGFEVRVELELPNGRKLWAQTTREAAAPLEPGKTVHVRPRATRTFDGDGVETLAGRRQSVVGPPGHDGGPPRLRRPGAAASRP